MIFVKNLVDNSSSKDMNIDGSIAPVSYFFSPSYTPAVIKSLTCLMTNPGSTAFGSFSKSLTNGITIKAKISGVISTIRIIKDKSDLISTFKISPTYIVSPNLFLGTLDFGLSGLNLSPGDYISVGIHDNFTSMEHLSMSVQISK